MCTHNNNTPFVTRQCLNEWARENERWKKSEARALLATWQWHKHSAYCTASFVVSFENIRYPLAKMSRPTVNALEVRKVHARYVDYNNYVRQLTHIDSNVVFFCGAALLLPALLLLFNVKTLVPDINPVASNKKCKRFVYSLNEFHIIVQCIRSYAHRFDANLITWLVWYFY